MQLSDWKPVPAPACQLAESPRWAHGHWFWLDIDGHRFYRCQQADLLSNSSAQAIEGFELDDDFGCALPTHTAGHYLLFGRKSISFLKWPLKAGQPASIECVVEPTFDPAAYRYNDGRADTNGRAVVSSLSDARQPGAALFSHKGVQATPLVEELIVGNGLAFSPDGKTMYLSDTRHRAIWRFDYDLANGKASHRELIAEYKDGAPRPDGATVASDGSYIVAIYEGYRLDRYSPQGQLIEQIEVPLAKPTMPCFGGPKLDQLLVASAKTDALLPNKAGFEDSSLVVAQSSLAGIPEPLVSDD